MKILTTKNSIVLAVLLIFLITNYFSFNAGQDVVEYRANRFTHIIVNTTYFLEILENIDEQKKVKEIAELALIDKLYDGLSAYEFDAMPISKHQVSLANKIIKRVKNLKEKNKINLFIKENQSYVLNYVNNNLDVFSPLDNH